MSRAQKEACVIVLDVGKNTSSDLGKDGRTFFERAKECVTKMITRKIFARPNDEFGIVLFGSDETDNDLNKSQLGYENITEMGYMEMPSWEMLEKIAAIEQGEGARDWIDALLVAINYIQIQTEAKRFHHLRIILITNFQTDTSDSDLDVIIENIQKFGIELIGVSNSVEYSNRDQFNSCQFSQNPDKLNKQHESEQIFESMIKQIEGAILCHLDYVESQLLYFQKKIGRPMPWNCSLKIGSSLSINVSAYVHVQEEKFFSSFKTHCIEDNTVTKTVKDYVSNNEIIEKPDDTDVTKGYVYGSKVVVIDGPDQEYQSGDKCLTLLGMCKANLLTPEKFTGKGSHIVVPQKGFEKSVDLFIALVKSMIKKDYIMLARKVYRGGAKPHVVALIPQVTDDNDMCLVMIELPFYEDTSEWAFPKLDSKNTQPNDEQMDAMKNLIDSMDLMNAVDNDSGITEAFTLETSLNPFHQHMCKTVAYRALNPNQPLPPFDEDLMKMIDIPDKIKKQSEEFIKNIEEMFPVEIVKQREKKPFGQNLPAHQNTDISAETQIADSDQSNERIITSVGSATPSEDFYYLIRKGTERFGVLCEQIQSIIYEFIFKTTSDLSQKLSETVMAYREMAKVHGPFYYNNWIAEIKTTMVKRNKIDEWNNIIVKEGFGLISINESPISSVSIEDQLEFYEVISKDYTATSALPENGDELEELL